MNHWIEGDMTAAFGSIVALAEGGDTVGEFVQADGNDDDNDRPEEKNRVFDEGI